MASEEDEDSPLLDTWIDLTDSRRSVDYTFDPETLEAISTDPEASSLRNQEDGGVRFRARRLEIFLTRVQAVRTLGETSIEGTE